jgi:hypothetical protein
MGDTHKPVACVPAVKELDLIEGFLELRYPSELSVLMALATSLKLEGK